jgi:hypothetical protein
MPDFENLWFNRADVLRREADDIVSNALRKAGWKYTSQTPGSVWMWQKDFGGPVYSVSQDRASDIQEMSDRASYFKQFPDELND